MTKTEKVYVYAFAITCGIAGFVVSYITLGYLMQPIDNWLENKIKGVR